MLAHDPPFQKTCTYQTRTYVCILDFVFSLAQRLPTACLRL